MNTFGILQNTVQPYAWGSCSAIAELTGNPNPSNVPQAEIWMGTHPRGPSRVRVNDRWIFLSDLIAESPDQMLGKTASTKFHGKLPYLFKILAAEKPLSIQAHPNKEQAEEGFFRENQKNIAINAFNRNYRDDNHKPECLCALTPFWALKGFRGLDETQRLLKRACPKNLRNLDISGLKSFFKSLMTLSSVQKAELIAETVSSAGKYDDPAFQWALRLNQEYPNDVGMMAPFFLNLVCLQPGEAIFLEAGELHVYLKGMGVELMADSDNVLRGGLTSKHIDLAELMRIVKFDVQPVSVLYPESVGECEKIYPVCAREFALSIISLQDGSRYSSFGQRSLEILLCVEGTAEISDTETKSAIEMSRGVSLIVPAAVWRYEIRGQAVLYKASIPLESFQ